MAKTSYENYKKMIPKRTLEFVIQTLKYLNEDRFTISGVKYQSKEENIFIKAINGYYDYSQSNKTLIKKYGTRTVIHSKYPNDLYTENAIKLFTSYYDYFCIYDHEEEKYSALTPDDILLNIIEKTRPTSEVINSAFDYEGLIGEMKSINKLTKISYESSIDQNNYKDRTINEVNYMETSGKILAYLRDNLKELKILDNTKDNLKAISLLASCFIYNHVDNNDAYNQKEIITDMFNSRNFSLEKLEEIIGIKFDLEKINSYDSTLMVDYYFNNDDFSIIKVFNNPNYAFAFKKILGEANLNLDVLNIIQRRVKKNNDLDINEINNYYINSNFDASKEINDILKITVYLNQNASQTKFVEYYDDEVLLATIISIIINNKKYKEFFIDHNLTIENISKSINLDLNIDSILNIEVSKKAEQRLKKFLYNGFQSINVVKDNIEAEDVLEILYDNAIISKLYSNNNIDYKYVEFDELKKYIQDKEDIKNREIEYKLFGKMDYYSKLFIKCLPKYYPTSNVSNKELIAVLKVALNEYFDGKKYNYFKGYMMSLNYAQTLKCDVLDKYDVNIINDHFKYLFDIKDINIYKIIEETFKQAYKDSTYNYLTEANKGCFENIESHVKEYAKKEEEIKKSIDFNLFKDNLTNESKNIIVYASKVYKYINDNNLYEEIIETEEDKKVLSLLISILKVDNQRKKFFINNGFNLDLFKDIDFTVIDKMKIEEYESIIFKAYIGELYHDDLNNNFKFDEVVKELSITKRICKLNNINFKNLKYEVIHNRERELTDEEKLDKFNSYKVPSINTASISDVTIYGNELSSYSSYINKNMLEITSTDTINSSINEINELLDNIYEKEEKKSIFAKLFAGSDSKLKPINSEVVKNIDSTINDHVQKLYSEIQGYDAIRKYIEVYILKLKDYIDNIKETDQKIDEKLKELDPNSIEDFARYMELSSLSDIVKDKKLTFEKSYLLMQRELISIHQMIRSHFKTINSLTAARDDILPLIVSETAINIGKKSEMQALELTNGLVNLFSNVVNRNVEATYENLEYLKNANLPENVYDKMYNDINLSLEDNSNKIRELK